MKIDDKLIVQNAKPQLNTERKKKYLYEKVQ